MIAGSVAAGAFAAMPHMLQLSADLVPFQKDFTAYADNTAWYSSWGYGLEGALRYVSPVGITLGFRGGIQQNPYGEGNLLQYPLLGTLGYRIHTEYIGIGLEGMAGAMMVSFPGFEENWGFTAGGRIYFEMPFTERGSFTAGVGALWTADSPVSGNAAVSFRLSVPVQIGFTYGIPLNAIDEKENNEESRPAAVSIGNISIFNEGQKTAFILMPGDSIEKNEATTVPETTDEIAVPDEINTPIDIPEDIDNAEETISQDIDEEAVPAESVEAEEHYMPEYVKAFLATPEGESIDKDVLQLMAENPEKYPYRYAFRRVSLEPDSPVRECWVEIEDPETGAPIRREITKEELYVFAEARGLLK